MFFDAEALRRRENSNERGRILLLGGLEIGMVFVVSGSAGDLVAGLPLGPRAMRYANTGHPDARRVEHIAKGRLAITRRLPTRRHGPAGHQRR
jgi:hypothetical protein